MYNENLDMYKLAKQFQNDHLGKGIVSNVNSYSFKYKTIPNKKDEQPKEYIYMITYFMKF